MPNNDGDDFITFDPKIALPPLRIIQLSTSHHHHGFEH